LKRARTRSGTRGGTITPGERIASIRRALASDAEVAEALGVARSQLTRWRAGQSPDDANRDRLVGLDAVVELLSGFLSPGTVEKWLKSPNAHLGNRRPLALLRADRLSEVIAAIEAEKAGAFA
jgi:transcriptional regulator with XRE-family HTH domain